MDLASLIDFLRWCTILNGVFVATASIFMIAAPNSIIGMQSQILKMDKADLQMLYWNAIAFLKILFIVFNVTPLLALALIS